MAYNIGLNVVEVDGAGAPAIVGAAVSVGAFNILTQRGVANRPVSVTSFTQFEQQFGGLFADGLGAYMVKGFFDNGGQMAYVNRVVASDSTTGAAPASITVQDANSANTLTLSAGFRGFTDPGTWADDLYVKIDANSSSNSMLKETAPATIQGSPLTAPIDMSAFPTLSITIDGAASPTALTFQASDFANPTQATLAEIRDAANRRTRALIASLSTDNRLVLTSTGEGAARTRGWTSLQVTADNTTLGFTTMATATQGTPATPASNGAQLASAQDFVVGDAVRIADNSNNAMAKLLRVDSATGDVEWTPAVANIGSFNAQQLTVSKVAFDLTVAQGGTDDASVVETWTGLSMEPDVPTYAVTTLNDSIRGSRYLTATDAHSSSGSGGNVPRGLAFTRVNAGRDGVATARDFIGDAVAHTGFYAFDPFDVQLVCCERDDAAIVTTALTYCANRGDCMFVGSVPQGEISGDLSAVKGYSQAFQGKKVYGALYGPWIKVFDPLGTGPNPVKWIPPTGHVIGVYARIESSRGIWKAPAGDEANLFGALDVEYRLNDVEHTELVKNGSVNGIRAVPGAGIVVDASRTLSTDTRWLYVNVRLLFNYVKSSLKQGLRWVRQEPNRDTLWNAVKFGSVTPFLMGLWRQGAFGTGTPAQVFTVICDATNNPPDQVDQGNFKIEVYFYPSKPAETIIIIVGQQPSGASAAEG